MSARQHRFDGDAVANVHAPALRGTIADFGDSAEWFVTWHNRHRRAEHPVVLFVVGTADAARFDTQECGVLVDIRYRNVRGSSVLVAVNTIANALFGNVLIAAPREFGERRLLFGEFGAQLRNCIRGERVDVHEVGLPASSSLSLLRHECRRRPGRVEQRNRRHKGFAL